MLMLRIKPPNLFNQYRLGVLDNKDVKDFIDKIDKILIKNYKIVDGKIKRLGDIKTCINF